MKDKTMTVQGFMLLFSTCRSSFYIWLLLLCLCGVGRALYIDDVEGDTAYICPDDYDTFKFDLSATYKGFGYDINTVFMASEGYITDVSRPNLADPGSFPKYSGTIHTLNCQDVEEMSCWIDLYYTDAEVEEILAEDYQENCVHGTELSEDFEPTFEDNYVAYARTRTPAGCTNNPDKNTEDEYGWMIAAFWQNIGAPNLESILWMRETTDASILSELSAAINALDGDIDFIPTSAAIFTWDKVSYLDGFAYGQPELTFQVVFVTDGLETYLVYNYKDLSFAGGQAGFDAGDRHNYCSLRYSRSGQAVKWMTESNVDIPGTWVLKFNSGYDQTYCEPLRGDVPICICDEGWEGRICAQSIDDCVDHTCPNNTLCVDGHNGYSCSYCENSECKNGGACVSDETNKNYTCECAGNHTGLYCEQCTDLTCLNGGQCSHNATSGESTCSCADGFSGDTCQIDDSQQSEPSSEESGLEGWHIALIVVGCVLLLLLIIIIIVIICKKAKKNDEVEPMKPEPPMQPPPSRHMTTASHV